MWFILTNTIKKYRNSCLNKPNTFIVNFTGKDGN